LCFLSDALARLSSVAQSPEDGMLHEFHVTRISNAEWKRGFGGHPDAFMDGK
jgi:hypothetical protein